MMPPAKEKNADSGGTAAYHEWIKADVFCALIEKSRSGQGHGPAAEPRRISNTIRDLIGVDYDTQVEFPPTTRATLRQQTATCSRSRRCCWKNT